MQTWQIKIMYLLLLAGAFGAFALGTWISSVSGV